MSNLCRFARWWPKLCDRWFFGTFESTAQNSTRIHILCTIQKCILVLIHCKHFVLDQHAELDFYSASSLKQQPIGRHVTPIRHIILNLSQHVFIVFGLMRPGLETHNRDKHSNHCITDAVWIVHLFCHYYEPIFFFLIHILAFCWRNS